MEAIVNGDGLSGQRGFSTPLSSRIALDGVFARAVVGVDDAVGAFVGPMDCGDGCEGTGEDGELRDG